MNNEIETPIENEDDTDAPLTVEVPSEIRAGVLTAPAARSCSPYSSCYSIQVLVASA